MKDRWSAERLLSADPGWGCLPLISILWSNWIVREVNSFNTQLLCTRTKYQEVFLPESRTFFMESTWNIYIFCWLGNISFIAYLYELIAINQFSNEEPCWIRGNMRPWEIVLNDRVPVAGVTHSFQDIILSPDRTNLVTSSVMRSALLSHSQFKTRGYPLLSLTIEVGTIIYSFIVDRNVWHVRKGVLMGFSTFVFVSVARSPHWLES